MTSARNHRRQLNGSEALPRGALPREALPREALPREAFPGEALRGGVSLGGHVVRRNHTGSRENDDAPALRSLRLAHGRFSAPPGMAGSEAPSDPVSCTEERRVGGW